MKPLRHTLPVLLALAVLGAAQPLLPVDLTDPARDLAPVRLFVSTRAGAVDVSVGNASVATFRSSIVSGREGVRASQTGQTLRISGNTPEEPAEAQFDLILADVPASGPIAWHVSADRPAQTVVDLQVLRDRGRSQSIDRFTTVTASQRSVTLKSDGAWARMGCRLPSKYQGSPQQRPRRCDRCIAERVTTLCCPSGQRERCGARAGSAGGGCGGPS